jgi:hypothetical protein
MKRSEYEKLIEEYKSVKEDLYQTFSILGEPFRKKLANVLSPSEFQQLLATNPRITDMFIDEVNEL